MKRGNRFGMSQLMVFALDASGRGHKMPFKEPELDSAFHHFAELATVWRLLPSDCLIMVDDRHSETSGKHFMVQFFMEKLGIEPVYKGHQIGWLKP